MINFYVVKVKLERTTKLKLIKKKILKNNTTKEQ